jgi:hypothetical protein
MKSEKNTNGSRRSLPSTPKPAQPAPVQPGHQRLVIDLPDDAHAMLVMMSNYDGDHDIERTVRKCMARDVQAFAESLATEDIQSMFGVETAIAQDASVTVRFPREDAK